MAKKSDEVIDITPPNTHLPSPVVVPELELKITKQDIIDAMIDEQDEKLEEQLEEVVEELDKTMTRGLNLLVDLAEKTKEAARTLKSTVDRVEKLKTFTGVDPVESYQVVSSPADPKTKRIKPECVLERHLILEVAESRYDRYGRPAKEQKALNELYQRACNVIVQGSALIFTSKSNTPSDSNYEDISTSGTFTVDLVPVWKALEELKDLDVIGAELDVLAKRKHELTTAKSKLFKMGSRAKSKLVKDLLGQTDQGKGILASMDSGKTAKQITKLLNKKTDE